MTNTVLGAEKFFILKGFRKSLLDDVFTYKDIKTLFEREGIEFDNTTNSQIVENIKESKTNYVHICHFTELNGHCMNTCYAMNN